MGNNIWFPQCNTKSCKNGNAPFVASKLVPTDLLDMCWKPSHEKPMAAACAAKVSCGEKLISVCNQNKLKAYIVSCCPAQEKPRNCVKVLTWAAYRDVFSWEVAMANFVWWLGKNN